MSLALICSVLLLWGCASPYRGQQECHYVSITQLLANGPKYQGKTVRVTGYLVLELENVALFPTELHAKRFLTADALWLTLTYKLANQETDALLSGRPESTLTKRYSGKYVNVVGIYESGRGHFDLYGGTIANVDLISLHRHGENLLEK